jgi:hypothetical protein
MTSGPGLGDGPRASAGMHRFACLAAFGGMFELLFLEEVLLASRKYEISPTIHTLKDAILEVHIPGLTYYTLSRS